MKILTTRVATHGPGGAHQILDTVEYQGALWLVPEWLDSREKGMTMPARIVRPLRQSFQKAHGLGVDYLLSHSLPTNVLSGQLQSGQESEFEVVELPPISIRGGHGVN